MEDFPGPVEAVAAALGLVRDVPRGEAAALIRELAEDNGEYPPEFSAAHRQDMGDVLDSLYVLADEHETGVDVLNDLRVLSERVAEIRADAGCAPP